MLVDGYMFTLVFFLSLITVAAYENKEKWKSQEHAVDGATLLSIIAVAE